MDIAGLIQQGGANVWLLVPSAILLGALHGLEPGHSKTMMAAFIVAIRGTVGQAILLGLAATLSHTAVVWVIALGGLYLWQGVAAEQYEPYLQLASAAIIIAVAVWMLWRSWQDQRRARAGSGGHDHDHLIHHDHHRADVRRVDTGHGAITVAVFEEGVPPRWRIRNEGDHRWAASDVALETERPDGSKQVFGFIAREGYLESSEEIPEPHEFIARLNLGHDGHNHAYDLAFLEDHGHDRDHIHEERPGLEVATDGYQNAHQLAHANDIRRKFAEQNVTTGQIVIFGLTGGLIPCPASITVLLLCLQLKKIALGATLVLSFSIGLALTLVAVGAAAALSARHISARTSWFEGLARRAPYVSGVLIVLVGLYMGYHGWAALNGA
jgi:nickel/cobalt transporter (NicO) family protein